jgi:hypothetical protein
VASLDELLANVDGVMVLNINGHRHLELAIGPIARGMPTYVDKPLTCSLDQARSLLAMTRQYKARCYSASSLRFVAEIPKMSKEKLGNIVAIDAFGNGELLDMMPHLWHYGCHSIEMVDAIFRWSGQGAGVNSVSAICNEDRHLLDMEYRDGRLARLRMDRKGAWPSAPPCTARRAWSSSSSTSARSTAVWSKAWCASSRGEAPVDLRDIVENVAVMEMATGPSPSTAWVDVPAIA